MLGLIKSIFVQYIKRRVHFSTINIRPLPGVTGQLPRPSWQYRALITTTRLWPLTDKKNIKKIFLYISEPTSCLHHLLPDPREHSIIFTARRNARIAIAVLATAIPSVCPSVTRRYCVETTARSTVQFTLSDSKMCLVFEKLKKYSRGTTNSPQILA